MDKIEDIKLSAGIRANEQEEIITNLEQRLDEYIPKLKEIGSNPVKTEENRKIISDARAIKSNIDIARAKQKVYGFIEQTGIYIPTVYSVINGQTVEIDTGLRTIPFYNITTESKFTDSLKQIKQSEKIQNLEKAITIFTNYSEEGITDPIIQRSVKLTLNGLENKINEINLTGNEDKTYKDAITKGVYGTFVSCIDEIKYEKGENEETKKADECISKIYTTFGIFEPEIKVGKTKADAIFYDIRTTKVNDDYENGTIIEIKRRGINDPNKVLDRNIPAVVIRSEKPRKCQ